MLLSDKEKSAKLSVLDELQKNIDGFGASRIKKSMPAVAEVSVAKMDPKASLLDAMKSAGHDGVEAAEESLFPKEEAAEDAMESGGPSESEKSMIAELYKKFCC